MANLISSFRRPQRQQPQRADPSLSMADWAQQWFGFNGFSYPVSGGGEIAPNFVGYVENAYKSNGVVYACMLVRRLLFSEVRFQFRRMDNGRPGELFGTNELSILERPWPNGTTGDLLARAIQDVDLSGNFYAARLSRDRLKRLRPDWVRIILGSHSRPSSDQPEPGDLDAELIGYAYYPGGPSKGREPVVFLPDQVAHFAPNPDPLAEYRGMSWLTPVIREIMGDQAMTDHKLKFFENGATVNLVVSFDPTVDAAEAKQFKEMFLDHHRGLAEAYETVFLGGGADVKPVGADMKQVDFKVTQGAGETRIAAVAGVPPTIVGLSEGLQGSSLNAGNYQQARRRLADGTMRPLWHGFADSMSTIVKAPNGAQLWYDDRDVPFLQEDVKDDAEIQQLQAITVRQLIEAGYEADAALDYVNTGDLNKLRGKHTGLVSVQLQEPGTGDSTSPATSGTNAAGRRLLEQHLDGHRAA